VAFNDDGIGAASGLEVEGHFGEGIIAEKRSKNVMPLSNLRATEASLREFNRPNSGGARLALASGRVDELFEKVLLT